MRKLLIRSISLVIALIFAISCFSLTTSAAKVTFKTGANGVSDAYKNSKYYKNLTQIELTGDGVTDLLAVALSQLEYVEGTNTSGFSGTQGGGGNYTEFCRNYGEGNAYAWCAAYVSFCLFQSNVTDSTSKQTIWRDIYCPRWYQNLKNAGYGHDASSSYTPKSGDLVFFTGGGHIGIVRYYKDGKVYTIEGNTSNSSGLNPEGGGVYCKSYDRNYSKFLGFGSLPYKTNNNALKVDYTGQNPTTGLWIGQTNKYLYPDTSMSDSSNYTVIPKGTVFEVTEVINKTCLKAKYDGKTGYVSVNSQSPIFQLTATEPPEPPIEKNTYYISKEIKKISGHFGSGIDKYYVDTKSSTKVKDPYNLTAGQQVGIQGFAGFDSFARDYGYYFDGDAASVVWNSKPIDADAETKKKGGDKTTEFKIMAPTDGLTDGEHTVTFAVKLLSKKEHPLITLNLNISGSTVGLETQPPATEAPITEAPITQAPDTVTDVPATEVPTDISTDIPVVDVPVTDVPVVDIPETEIPTIEDVTDQIIDTESDNGGCADATDVPETQLPWTEIITEAPATEAITMAPIETLPPVTEIPTMAPIETLPPVTEIPTMAPTETFPPVTEIPTMAPIQTLPPVTEIPTTVPTETLPIATEIPTIGVIDTGVATGTGTETVSENVPTEIGCGATVAIAALMPTLLAAGFVMIKKKKDD